MHFQTVSLWYKLWFLVKSLTHALTEGLRRLRKIRVQLVLLSIRLTLSHLFQVSVSCRATSCVACSRRLNCSTLREQSRSLIWSTAQFSLTLSRCPCLGESVTFFTGLSIQHCLVVLNRSIFLLRKLQILGCSHKRFVISFGLVKRLLKSAFKLLLKLKGTYHIWI